MQQMEHSHTAARMQNGTTTLENNLKIIYHVIHPCHFNSFTQKRQKYIYIYKDVHTTVRSNFMCNISKTSSNLNSQEKVNK